METLTPYHLIKSQMKQIGNSGDDMVYPIAIDSSDKIYNTGGNFGNLDGNTS